MSVQEIKTKIRDLLDDLSAPLPRDQYRELVEGLQFEMQSRIDCLDDEEAPE